MNSSGITVEKILVTTRRCTKEISVSWLESKLKNKSLNYEESE